MRKKSILVLIFLLCFVFASGGFARTGLYLGIQGGYSAQKPSLKDVEFNTDTTFVYGLRAGIRVLMIGVEASYFQAAHNLDPADILSLDWGEREIDYNFLGLNLKYFFPLIFLNPYITAGYGYYTADIDEIDKDKNGGYNLGLGLELNLGRLSLTAEGKYHHVKLEIEEMDLKIGDFTLVGGLSFYF
jgi:opacity protein-like surface antigen